jgi:hypothetical protein
MKTTAQIVEYCKKNNDIFGFTLDVLVPYLPREDALQFLEPDFDNSKWRTHPPTEEEVLADIQRYMEFAWGKARDHRGLSAGRSITKMQAWLWLLDEDDLLLFSMDDSNYPSYGAPILKKICEKYNFPIPEGEDIANMAQGFPCYPGCEEGCCG